ncbi:MAG: hypothetical protein R2847_01555 [Bacteroidia bacterium]
MMIVFGVALINKFSWIIYVFGSVSDFLQQSEC